MFHRVITPPVAEPITLAEAKLHLRVTHDAENTLITTLIKAAREYCEGYTGRALATQVLEAYPDGWPASGAIELPRAAPLQSVTSVKYTDRYGAVHGMVEGADYAVDIDSTNGRIVLPYNESWPHATLAGVTPITIRYVAGYALLPESIRQAMLLLIGHWFVNRETTGEPVAPLAFTLPALLAQHRVRWFG